LILAGELRTATRHFKRATLLDLAQRIEHLGRFNFGDWVLPQNRKDVALQALQDVPGGALLPATLFVRVPLARDHLERVRRRDAALLLGGAARLCGGDAGVDLLLYLQALSRAAASVTTGVGAESQAVLLAVLLGVAQPPEFGTDWGDFEVEPAAVRKLLRFLTRFRVFDLRFGQRQRKLGHFGAIRSRTWSHLA
jgi:hypothetical protein